jgi:hypothetical protein
MNIECDQPTIAELEHGFKFNDAVLRHLSIRMKKAVTTPVADDEGRKGSLPDFRFWRRDQGRRAAARSLSCRNRFATVLRLKVS